MPRRRGRRPATPLDENAVAREPSSQLSREDGLAALRCAGLVRCEINSQAGWSSVGRSWRWHRPSVAIRWSTDETPWPAALPTSWAKMRGAGGSTLKRFLRATSTRNAAAGGGLRSEIDSQAGWIGRRPVVGIARPLIAIRWSTDETRGQRPGHSLERKCGGAFLSSSTRNATRAQRRGWVTTRDRLHGRVVMRRSVVEMAPTVGRNPVVDGRDPVAGGPATPLNENVTARKPSSNLSCKDVNAQRSGAGWATARDRFPGRVDRVSADRGDGTAGHRDTVVNRRATSPDPRPQARVSAVSRTAAPGSADGIFIAATDPDRDRQRACLRSPESCASGQVRGLPSGWSCASGRA